MDFIGKISPIFALGHAYIIVANDYATKWAEAQDLKDNTAKSTAAFIFDHIITHFGCPLEIIYDRINILRMILSLNLCMCLGLSIKHIIHKTSTSYYPHANGQT